MQEVTKMNTQCEVEEAGVDTTVPPIEEKDKKEKKIAVVEIFGPTIQGEGPLAGSKTMFIRFGGCDYRCQKCDSLHAVIPAAVKANARYLTAEQIADEVQRLRGLSGAQWVTLSGGNPLMWDLSRLIDYLHGNGLSVAVETQGTLFKPWLTRAQCVVISPKGPGMGEKFEPDKLIPIVAALHEKGVATAIKVVVFSQQDFDFALEVQQHIFNAGEIINPGMFFMSLGNPYPPVLTEEQRLKDNPALTGDDALGLPAVGNHRLVLLNDYKVLIDDFVNDPRIHHWRFLPQLHVLVYSNESER